MADKQKVVAKTESPRAEVLEMREKRYKFREIKKACRVPESELCQLAKHGRPVSDDKAAKILKGYAKLKELKLI